jgi:sialate O-acetylesterase
MIMTMTIKTPISYFKQLSLMASLAILSLNSLADVSLPRLLSDGAVLQREKPLSIWGWADEGEKVSVTFAGKELSTVTKDGRWSVTFPAMKAGGPFELKVIGKNQLVRSNILLGDVWVAAGQSNMELPLNRVKYKYPGLIESTNQPNIREFNVPVAYSFKGPLQDYTQGQWKTAMPENLAGFSAVGFFFMQKLHTENNVPIGLLTIPVGGSPAEAWVSESVLEKYPHYQQKLTPFKDDAHVQTTIAKDKANSEKWYTDLGAADIGLKNNWQQEKLIPAIGNRCRFPVFSRSKVKISPMALCGCAKRLN